MSMNTAMADAQPNSEKPLVSCIIIFLDGEDYIEEAIDSVLAQSYSNWELILVDDGSTDSATAIAKRFAAEQPGRITYTQHPDHENRGMSASRNAGLQRATGHYVAFLDADDIWLPGRLERHVSVLNDHPDVAMTIAPTMLWSSWNKKNLPKSRPWLAADIETELGLPTGRALAPPYLATACLSSHGACVPGICSLTIRRDALLEVEGSEDAFRTLYEDQVLLFKILLNFPVIVINDILDYYRQHESSACGQAGRTSGDGEARPRFLQWLQEYMIDMGAKDTDLWSAFRGEMWKYDNPKAYRLVNLPNSIVDTWNIETRYAVIWLLTPKVYQRLRRLFGLSVVDFGEARRATPS